MKFQRGPADDGQDRNPQLDVGEIVERIRARIDMRDATPEMFGRDAQRAQARHPQLTAACYLGVSTCHYVFVWRRRDGRDNKKLTHSSVALT